MKHIKKFRDQINKFRGNKRIDLLSKLDEFDQNQWRVVFDNDPAFIEIAKEDFINKNRRTRFENIYPKKLYFLRTIDTDKLGYTCLFDEEDWCYNGTIEIEKAVRIYVNQTS
jgi:hypothetical protein